MPDKQEYQMEYQGKLFKGDQLVLSNVTVNVQQSTTPGGLMRIEGTMDYPSQKVLMPSDDYELHTDDGGVVAILVLSTSQNSRGKRVVRIKFNGAMTW